MRWSLLLVAACEGGGAAVDAPGFDGPLVDVGAGEPIPCAARSLRFHGNGAGDVDRVKIRIDDPATTTAGPPADVGATDFTIELWLRGLAVDNPAPAVACGDGLAWINGNIVVDRDRFNVDRKFGLSIAGGALVWGVSGDGSGDKTICGTTNVLDDRWHHVAVDRRRSDGRIRLFVDGALQREADAGNGDISYPDDAVPGNFCGGPCTNSDPYLVIGAEKHDAGAAYPSFDGYVDELRLSTVLRYPAAFTPGTTPFAADAQTAALYHFDEPSGDAIVDVLGTSPGVLRFGGTPAGPTREMVSPLACP